MPFEIKLQLVSHVCFPDRGRLCSDQADECRMVRCEKKVAIGFEMAAFPFEPVGLKFVFKYILLHVDRFRRGDKYVIRLLQAAFQQPAALFQGKMFENVHHQDQVIVLPKIRQYLKGIPGVYIGVDLPVDRGDVFFEHLDAIDPALPVPVKVPPVPQFEVLPAEIPVLAEPGTYLQDLARVEPDDKVHDLVYLVILARGHFPFFSRKGAKPACRRQEFAKTQSVNNQQPILCVSLRNLCELCVTYLIKKRR
jgi:hypothetical protein